MQLAIQQNKSEQAITYQTLCCSIHAAQAVREAALLRVVRHPQQGGAQQVQEGPPHPHAAQEQLPAWHAAPAERAAEVILISNKIM